MSPPRLLLNLRVLDGVIARFLTLLRQVWQPVIEIPCEVLPGGRLPSKAHPTDAGFDLYATENVIIYDHDICRMPLNIRLALPPGTYMDIVTKSGLGFQGHLVYAGVIDEGYRGIPHVLATYLGSGKPIVIVKGAKIAQGIVHPFGPRYVMRQVDHVATSTVRGTGGFGSTGM